VVAALEKAVQLSPQRAELHNQLVSLPMAGDFGKARPHEQSISLDAATRPPC
jgi:hypothetical protein